MPKKAERVTPIPGGEKEARRFDLAAVNALLAEVEQRPSREGA
jgi:hypothetical protein